MFDLAGKEVATLADCSHLPAGNDIATLDTRGLSSGVYLYRLETGGASLVWKLVVMK